MGSREGRGEEPGSGVRTMMSKGEYRRERREERDGMNKEKRVKRKEKKTGKR